MKHINQFVNQIKQSKCSCLDDLLDVVVELFEWTGLAACLEEGAVLLLALPPSLAGLSLFIDDGGTTGLFSDLLSLEDGVLAFTGLLEEFELLLALSEWWLALE